MTAILKYTCVDTPIDFAKFVANSFSATQINQTKNLTDRVNLVATAINFAEIWGYTHEGMKKVAEQAKAFKLVSGAVQFIPSAMSYPASITVSSVVDFSKNFFTNGAAFLTLLDKCKHPVSAASIKMMGGIGAAAGGVSAAIGLTNDVAQIERNLMLPSGRTRNLQVLSGLWAALQKITLIAVAAISVATTLVATYVAVPTISPVVVPSLLMSAAVLGLFNRYVAQHAAASAKTV